MISMEKLYLQEQKYIGIKTKILFADHDKIDFQLLHKNVIEANISNIDSRKNFIALDSDFSKTSFCYTPLVPVKTFDDNDGFEQFIREEGLYYGFSVVQKECNPNWFKELAVFIKKNNIGVKRFNYDLEYYTEDYLERMNNPKYCFEDELFMILLKAY